jgi:hypothetical protein
VAQQVVEFLAGDVGWSIADGSLHLRKAGTLVVFLG